MKHFILFGAMLAMFCLCACNKENHSASVEQVNPESCSLSVDLSDVLNLSTKVTGPRDDAELNFQNVQIFVFRSAPAGSSEPEVLDACVSKSSAPFNDIQLSCTIGRREIWAVVNSATDYCADGSVRTKADLLAKTQMLESSQANSLLMIGSIVEDLLPGKMKLNIPVVRACAKVVLQSVKNEMEAVAYRGKDYFKIKDIYLTNVPASIDFTCSRKASDLSESQWYAKRQKETDSRKSALILDSQSAKTLDYGSTYNTVHTFYSFPNECPSNEDEVWSPRATRLVIEAEFYDGSKYHTCYYPITLYNESTSSGLERNKQYFVNLTVKRPGSDHPDKKVEFETVTGSITVAKWDSGETYTETI